MGCLPRPKVSQKTPYISPKNRGRPRTRWVTTVSIRSLTSWRSWAVCWIVSWQAPEMNPYLRSAITMAGSSLKNTRSLAREASRTGPSPASRTWAVTWGSCSRSLTATHLGP